MAFTHSSTKTLLIFLFDHLFQLQIFGHCPGYGVGGLGCLIFEKKNAGIGFPSASISTAHCTNYVILENMS